MAGPLTKFLSNNPSILIFLTILSLITAIITIGSDAISDIIEIQKACLK